MQIRENEPLKPKTTMRIGGTARYFADLTSKEDVEKAYVFAKGKRLPLVILGAGSNTIFTDETVEALVVRITADAVEINGNTVKVEVGKNLAMLVNELAKRGLDLSPLTGIPGTVGGALVGNAGQGPQGIWLDAFVENVTAFLDGKWKEFSKEECEFAYRESIFKKLPATRYPPVLSEACAERSRSVEGLPAPIIWQSTLVVPAEKPEKIQSSIETLLQQRLETQPHARTSGSCFKATGNSTPAWELIDAAGLRGHTVGGIRVSEKHANFLINDNDASFSDVCTLIRDVQGKVPDLTGIEMRLIDTDGIPVF